jgi:hypothetical protein
VQSITTVVSWLTSPADQPTGQDRVGVNILDYTIGVGKREEIFWRKQEEKEGE